MCLPKKVKGSTIQKIAILVGNLLSLNFGLTFGITPQYFKLYASEWTPLNSIVTTTESAWVACSLFFSAAVGSLAFGSMSSIIGSKSVLMLSGLMQITGWFCMHFAYDILHIYASKIFAGVAAGAAMVTLPLYVADITQSLRHRSGLTVSQECWRNFGIFMGLAMATYVQYEFIPIVGLVISIVFTLTFPFIQESPFYYIRDQDMARFEKSMRWFRGIRSLAERNNADFECELRQIKHFASDNSQTDYTKGVVRPFIAGLILVVAAQLSGTFTIFFYGLQIMSSINISWFKSDIAILILGGVQVISSIVAQLIVQRKNKRVIIFMTSLASSLCLISSIVFLSSGIEWHLNKDLEHGLLCSFLVGHGFFVNLGCLSYSTLILTEIFSRRIRCRCLSILHFASWLIVPLQILFYRQIVQEKSTNTLLFPLAIGSVTLTVWSLFPFTKPLTSTETMKADTDDVTKIREIASLHI